MNNIYNVLDKFMGIPIYNDSLSKAIGIVRIIYLCICYK